MHSTIKTLILTLVIGLFLSSVSLAEEGLKSKAKEAGKDLNRGARRAERKIKDKTCELVNGKMECAAKKIKHGVQNAADKIEDAID